MVIKLLYLAFIILVVRFVFKTAMTPKKVKSKPKHEDAIDAEYTVLDDEKRS